MIIMVIKLILKLIVFLMLELLLNCVDVDSFYTIDDVTDNAEYVFVIDKKYYV